MEEVEVKPCPDCGTPTEATKMACNECWAALPLAHKKARYLHRDQRDGRRR